MPRMFVVMWSASAACKAMHGRNRFAASARLNHVHGKIARPDRCHISLQTDTLEPAVGGFAMQKKRFRAPFTDR